MQKLKFWEIILEFCVWNWALCFSHIEVPQLNFKNQLLFYFCEFSLALTKPRKPAAGEDTSPVQQTSQSHHPLCGGFVTTTVGPTPLILFHWTPSYQTLRIDHRFDLKPCGPYLIKLQKSVPVSECVRVSKCLLSAF